MCHGCEPGSFFTNPPTRGFSMTWGCSFTMDAAVGTFEVFLHCVGLSSTRRTTCFSKWQLKPLMWFVWHKTDMRKMWTQDGTWSLSCYSSPRATVSSHVPQYRQVFFIIRKNSCWFTSPSPSLSASSIISWGKTQQRGKHKWRTSVARCIMMIIFV